MKKVLFFIAASMFFSPILNMNPEEQVQQATLAELPSELKLQIITHLPQSTGANLYDLSNAIRDIKALLLTNKSYAQLLNDPQFINFIINFISEQLFVRNIQWPNVDLQNQQDRANVAKIGIALFLRNPEATQWLRNFMHQYPQIAIEFINNAIRENRQDLIKYLIAAGVDLNVLDSNGATALDEATRVGNEPILDLLINAGANLSSSLTIAIYKKDINLIDRLLKAGATLDPHTNPGMTALHMALHMPITATVAHRDPNPMLGLIRKLKQRGANFDEAISILEQQGGVDPILLVVFRALLLHPIVTTPARKSASNS